MKLFKQISFTFLIMLSVFSFSQQKKIDCSVLKSCKLLYIETLDSPTYITIKNNEHIELSEDGSFYIKSHLDWKSDCEYEATIIELKVDGSPFKVGDKLKVKIDNIENDIVYITANYKNEILKASFRIVIDL